MVWVRLDDHFDENPKIAAVGPLGIALWVTGLAYCNRNLTDGFIPWTTAQSLLSWEYLDVPEEDGRRRRQEISTTCGMSGNTVTNNDVIRLLLDAGLWEELDNGYQIHDFAEFQPSKEQVLSDRRGSAERTRQSRARNAVSNNVTNIPVTVVPVPVPVGTKVPNKASGTPIPLPQKAEVTVEWLAEERAVFKGRLPESGFDSFDKVVEGRMNQPYFKKATDRCKYLHGQLEDAAERWAAKQSPNGHLKPLKAEGIFE